MRRVFVWTVVALFLAGGLAYFRSLSTDDPNRGLGVADKESRESRSRADAPLRTRPADASPQGDLPVSSLSNAVAAQGGAEQRQGERDRDEEAWGGEDRDEEAWAEEFDERLVDGAGENAEDDDSGANQASLGVIVRLLSTRDWVFESSEVVAAIESMGIIYEESRERGYLEHDFEANKHAVDRVLRAATQMLIEDDLEGALLIAQAQEALALGDIEEAESLVRATVEAYE